MIITRVMPLNVHFVSNSTSAHSPSAWSGAESGVFLGASAKAGVLNWDSEAQSGVLTVEDTGADDAYGVGVRFQLGSLALRAEYAQFDFPVTVMFRPCIPEQPGR